MSEPGSAAIANRPAWVASAIERYLARPAHGDGMTFRVEVPVDVIDGPEPKAEDFVDAWRQTCRSHVRTHSSLRSGRWVPGPLTDAVVAAGPGDRPIPVDLASGRGAMLTLIRDEAHWRLVWQFHHAVCDGYGAGRLIFECLKRYHGAPPRARESIAGGGQVDEPPERPGSAAIAPPNLRHLSMTIRGVNARLRSRGGPAEPIVQRGESANVSHWRPGGQASAELRDRVRASGTPLNDVAVAVAMRSIAAVIDAPAASHVMLLNPTQTRTWPQRRRTDNHLGMILPRRRIDQLGDWNRTFGSLREQMLDVRRHRYDRDLPAGIAAVSRIPGALWALQRLGWFTPTASLTCLSAFNVIRQGGFAAVPGGDGCSRRGEVQLISGQRAPGYSIDLTSKKPSQSTTRLWPRPIDVVGPIQAGGDLAIAIWDDGQQIAASFRFAHPDLRASVGGIMEVWDDTFEQLRRGAWSLDR